MPVYFTFSSDDGQISQASGGAIGALSASDITSVARWQNKTLGYEFSFHEGHDKGRPVYITRKGVRGGDMSKINLNGKDAGTVLNAKKIDGKIKKDAEEVVASNWELFEKLAEYFYEGAPAPPAQQTAPSFQCKKCGPISAHVASGLQPNAAGFLECPKCGQWLK